MSRARSILCGLASVTALAESSGADAGGTWQVLQPLQIARQETGAARIGGFVYVAGGLLDGSPLRATPTVERYELASGKWSFVTPLDIGLDHAGAAAWNGKLWVVGGYAADFVPRNEVRVYDPDLDVWSLGPPLPEARGAGVAVVAQDKLLFFGGVGPNGTSNTTYVLESAVGLWQTGAPMARPSEHLTAAVVEPYAYVIGGRFGSSWNRNDRYDPIANTWAERAPMPTARSAMSTAALGGKIYVMGGEIPRLFAVNEVYDPSMNAWECRAPMRLARHGAVPVTIDEENRILVPAGGVVQGLEPTNEMDAYMDDPVPVLPGGPADGAGVGPAAGGLRVAPAHPNPTGGPATIRFALDRSAPVRIAVLDAGGRLVRLLGPTAARGRGAHRVVWDGRDRSGRRVSSGVYVVRLWTPDGGDASRRVAVVR